MGAAVLVAALSGCGAIAQQQRSHDPIQMAKDKLQSDRAITELAKEDCKDIGMANDARCFSEMRNVYYRTLNQPATTPASPITGLLGLLR